MTTAVNTTSTQEQPSAAHLTPDRPVDVPLTPCDWQPPTRWPC